MRVWGCLLAAVAFSGAAFAYIDGAPVYRTPMPDGGMDLIQPGYTLRTPGKGWIMTSSVKPQNGAIRGVEHFETFVFARETEIWDRSLYIEVMHWPLDLADITDLKGYVRERAFRGMVRLPIPGERFTVEAKTINGAPCAVSRSEVKKRYETGGPLVSAAEVHQICAHPEFAGFAVELRYEAGDATAEAELARVAQSLTFTPLPYRVREIRPGCRLGPMAEADGALWTPCGTYDQETRGKVLRIDPATNAVAASIEVGRSPSEVVAAGEYLWAGNLYDDTVSRIDPKTNTVTATVGLSDGPIELLAAGGYLWVEPLSRELKHTDLVRINPATAAIDRAIRFDTVVIGFRGAGRWIFAAGDRLDGVTGEVTGHIELGETTQILHYDGRLLWLEEFRGDQPVIFTLDPDALDKPPVEVRRLDIGASDVALWNGEFCALSETAVHCGPPDGALTREVPIVPYTPAKLRVFAGSLWVEDWQGSSILRLDPK